MALKGINPTHWIPRPGHEVHLLCDRRQESQRRSNAAAGNPDREMNLIILTPRPLGECQVVMEMTSRVKDLESGESNGSSCARRTTNGNLFYLYVVRNP